MRTARTAVAITAAIMAGGAFASPAAQANPEDAEAAPQEVAAGETVVLPTGDKVTVLPDGTAAIEPAEGREDIGFITPPAFDGSGEIIVVPTDKVADIQAGLEDPRLYNVTRLLEAGVTDAAEASVSALDDREYNGFLPDTTVEAATAQPVSVEVEREDAVFLDAAVAVEAKVEGEFTLGYGNYAGPTTDVFLLPEPELPEFDLGFIYQPVLTSPEGSAEPYTYNFALGEDGGYPDDTEYAFADDELAQVETHLQGLGVPVPGQTCDYGDFVSGQVGAGFCRLVPVEFPSTRTMLYSPGPDLYWEHASRGGIFDESGYDLLKGFTSYEAAVQYPEAGETERDVIHGPLSTGAPIAVRFLDGEDVIFGAALSPAASDNRESLRFNGYEGTATLSRDGELVGEAEGVDEFYLPMADVPGRYTLAAQASHDSEAGLFATASEQSWSFDLGAMPEEEFERLALPYVALGIEDVEGGWVEDDGSVEVTLQAMAGDPAVPIDVESMTFEVSYDDGKTWKQVSIDRNGGTAEAEFCPPRRAEFVSVRMTGVDTAGTEFSHTTIRSFGLD